ncbi:MAG: hypothetical protein GY801_48005, partial [bacterium]|nr:hypothetical protein [bacterium]
MFKSIRFKMMLLGGLPLLVALTFMLSSIRGNFRTVGEMDRLLSLSQFAVKISALVHETQKERGVTAGFMGSDGTTFVTELTEQRQQTNAGRTVFEQALDTLEPDAYGEEFSNRAHQVVNAIAGLEDHRTAVSNQAIPDVQGMAFYTHLNGLMLNVIHMISTASPQADMVRFGTAYANFLQGKERAGQERAVMSKVFAADRFATGDLRRFSLLVNDQRTYFEVFRSLATPEQLVSFDQMLSDPVVAEVQGMRDIAFTMGEVRTEGFGVESDLWFTTMTAKINLLQDVDLRLSTDIEVLAQRKLGGLHTVLRLSVAISDVVHAMQKERGLTAGVVGSQGRTFGQELSQQRRLTDTSRQALYELLDTFTTDDLRPEFVSTLDRAVASMEGLDRHRSAVDAQTVTDQEAIGFYTQQNARLLAVIAAVPGLTTDGEIRSQLTGYVNFLQGKERAGLERAVMNKVFTAGRFAEGELRRFSTLVTAQDIYFTVFKTLASPDQVRMYEQTLAEPAIAEVHRMRETAFASGTAELGNVGVEAGQWFRAMTAKIDLMRDVEHRLSADIEELAQRKLGGLQSLLRLSVLISECVHAMQMERGLTAGFVGSQGTKFGNDLVT